MCYGLPWMEAQSPCRSATESIGGIHGSHLKWLATALKWRAVIPAFWVCKLQLFCNVEFAVPFFADWYFPNASEDVMCWKLYPWFYVSPCNLWRRKALRQWCGANASWLSLGNAARISAHGLQPKCALPIQYGYRINMIQTWSIFMHI